MASLKIFLILAFALCVVSEKILKKECDPEAEDFNACAADVTQDYFRKHSGGLPEHNLKAVDPITIPELIIKDDELGFNLIYNNVKVTGFKDVAISDLKIDTKSGKSEFNMKFDIDAEGDMRTEMKEGKTFSGTFKYEGSVTGDTKYTYTEKKQDNGEVIYLLGPETISCKATSFKESYNKELTEAFDKDPDVQDVNNKFKNADFAREYNEKVLCKIATVVFQEAVDVLRNIAKQGE